MMTNRLDISRKTIFILLGLMISCLTLVISMQLFISKCIWWDCAPKRAFTVFDLTLPTSLFPQGSSPPALLRDRGTIEAVEEARDVTLLEDNGEAVYIVKKFATFEQSKKWFRANRNSYPYTEVLYEGSQVAEILGYEPSYADEFSLQCGYLISHLNCSFQARYEEFYVQFNSSISDAMRPEDYLAILKYIDSRLGDLLRRLTMHTGYS